MRRAEEVTELRKHTRLPLVAKIEKPQAVERIEEIVRAADCVMVARGDLGIEMRIEEVPIVQKQVIALRRRARPPRDHRDADARLDGRLLAADARRGHRRRQRDPRRHRRGDALPGERGRRSGRSSRWRCWPTIAERTEQTAPYREWNEHRVRRDRRDPAYTLAYTADAGGGRARPRRARLPDAVGRSARLISAHRPTVPIWRSRPAARPSAAAG